ncbi:MAG: hypothetical protein ACJ8GN_17010 [Longimicrobiaceae bacterium]
MLEATSIAGIVTSGAVGLVAGFIGSVLAERTRIDESVRAARLECYTKLWRKTELLPAYPVAAEVTYDELLALTEEMRDWYFREGGMYLSKASRKRYGDAQEEIGRVIGGKLLVNGQVVESPRKAGTLSLSDPEYVRVQHRLSALRTSMAGDLLARSRTLTIG